MASTTATIPVGHVGGKMTDDDREGRMVLLAGGEEEEKTCLTAPLGGRQSSQHPMITVTA